MRKHDPWKVPCAACGHTLFAHVQASDQPYCWSIGCDCTDFESKNT